MISLRQLLQTLPGLRHPLDRERTASKWERIQITSVTADSRTVTPGALFVAVQGGAHDGHAYLADAFGRGAVAALGTVPADELAGRGGALPPDAPYLQVENSRLALAYASAALHGFPSRDLAVIGVTGTDGKTTTCTLVESILNVATRPAAEPGSQAEPYGLVGAVTTVAARIRGRESETGLHVTTPDAPEVQRYLAEMRDAGCRYAVIESTSHGLDQERVAAVAFDIAAVTNITHEHLDYHGTRDAYVQAKAKLFRALYTTPAKPGVPRCAVLNADDAGSYDALAAALAEEAARHGFTVPIWAYGLRADPEAAKRAVTQGELRVAATEVVYSPQETRLTLLWPEGELAVSTPLIGEFNVYNVACAAAVALALGIGTAAIRAGIAEMAGVSGRMERIDEGQPFLAVVDFAHSPASLERALHTLRPLVGVDDAGRAGRLIAVFGSAGLRDREKRGKMGEVSGRLADMTVITAEDPRTEDLNAINEAIAAGVRRANPQASYVVIPDRAAAIQAAVDMARPGDVVASFGKGHERSMCFGTTEYPWSDQEAMRTALVKRLAQERGRKLSP
ncbi:MAG TPA: UDP-N-acetylmuramoyl-L-alanyl-D-glutamate--2,6-diaminopimelate ligase [Caldilineaceae bacterium]|nr:UDP-N-acetylmuramoyl-L-alanyl-D-glutamate--2,6-diaminopimelate ligase [Caldilineaceae bacterium]